MSLDVDAVADAIILLGRGGYSGVPQEYLAQLLGPVQTTVLARHVCSAFVDQGEPSLPAALQSCAAAGAQRILVQPVYLPADRNLHRWLGKVIKRWHAHWQGHAVEVLLAEPLGEQAAIGAALIDILQTASQSALNVIQDPPEKWEQDPVGWSKLPDHRYHAFFCRGPRCTALGADKLAQHLREGLKANKLLQEDRVLVAQTGCLYPCNLGPLLVVYPDGVWYGRLDEHAIDRIISEHFLGRQVVDDYVVHRLEAVAESENHQSERKIA